MPEVQVPAVPAASLEQTVKQAREDGATRIVITKNGDGTFDVIATFP
jgi:DNA-binding MurR/RpiR family transcriptional regulator